MTEPSEPDRTMAAAIRVLRHDILSGGRQMSWDDVRGRIRRLIMQGHPSPPEHIQLLELYDMAASMAGRRIRLDLEASRRLGHQRANDTLAFLMAEFREQGPNGAATIASIIARELAAERMHLDGYMQNVASLLLEKLDDGDERPPTGVSEELGSFVGPPASQPPTRQPALSAMAVKNAGS
jgi:hypothetical protein